MALPQYNTQLDDATLAKQYDAIRRGGGTSSARDMRKAFREGGFGDETQTDYGTGVRRAGWQNSAVAPESMPEVDSESRYLLGGRLGEYTTGGGQKQYGYYGDVDVFDRGQLDPWLTKTGFSYAKGAEDPEYVKAGLDLPSLWKNPLFKTGEYDFTQKYGYGGNKGVNDYMSSLGYGIDMGQNFDLTATTQLPGLSDTFTKVKDFYGKKSINDYLSSIGYSDITNSEYKPYAGFVPDAQFAKTGGSEWWNKDVNQFGFGNQQDPNKILSDMWNSLGGNEIGGYTPSYQTINGQTIPDGFEYTQDGWRSTSPFGLGENPLPSVLTQEGNVTPQTVAGGYGYRGKTYTSQAEAEAAKQANLQQALSNPAIRNELLAQALTTGKLGGTFASDPTKTGLVQGPWGSTEEQLYRDNRGRFGGDEIANQLTPEMVQKILGSKDILYGGSKLGSIFNDPTKAYQDNWSDYSQTTRKNKWGTQKKTTTDWDYGDVGATLNFKDPNWFANNAFKAGDNGMFVSNDKLASMPGATAEDWYNREEGRDVQKSLTGLGKIVGAGLNFIPVVGPLASMAFNSISTGQKPGLAQLAGTVLGMGGGLGNMGLSTGSKLADAALVGAGTGGLSALEKGGGFGDALKGAALGGAGGAAGNYLGDLASTYSGEAVGNYLGPNAGKIASRLAGAGAGTLGRGIVNKIGGGNQSVQDMLTSSAIAAATGGVGAAAGQGLNSLFNPGNDKALSSQYNTLAKNVSSLAPQIYNAKEKQQKQNAINERNAQLQQAYLNKFKTQMARA